MFPDITQLAGVADKLGNAATDIASRVESIENLLREQNALIAQGMEHAGINTSLVALVSSRPLLVVGHNVLAPEEIEDAPGNDANIKRAFDDYMGRGGE